jgi:hypothetical protein
VTPYTPLVSTLPTTSIVSTPAGPSDPPAHDFTAPIERLLAPISLLGGAPQRSNNPPGIFFVTKGRNLSGIVTGDGRSVIKKPLVWSFDKPEPDGDCFSRIEMLVSDQGSRTVIVGFGRVEAKAIDLGGEMDDSPACTITSLPPPKPSDYPSSIRAVQHLGTQHSSNQLFYSERVGQSFTVFCLLANQ